MANDTADLIPAAAERSVGSATDTVAGYVAKALCADFGFTLGTVAEAEPLAAACDFVLTKSDGMSFELACIVDREVTPDRTFALPAGPVLEAAKACLRYAGAIHGNQLPVVVQIFEVGTRPPGPEDLQRLRRLSRRMPGREKVVVTAWSFDATNARAWSSAPLNGLLARRRYFERLLREPRRSDKAMARPHAALANDLGAPWLTYTLIAILALAFVGELVFGVRPFSGLLAPDTATLVALGGLGRRYVLEGEWHRVLTAPFLHADVVHLVLNGLALWFGGAVVESMLGRAWLAASFVVGALGGAALSLALHPHDVVSVGASGAIMGLLATALAVSGRLPSGAERLAIQMRLLQVLVPSLLPLAIHRLDDGQIDYAAHLGGALAGAALGILLIKTWLRAEPLPRFRAAAAVLALAAAVALAAGFVVVKRDYAEYAAAAARPSFVDLLIPEAEAAGSDDEWIARSDALVQRYPRDPRPRLFLALRLARAGDLVTAESHLRTALAEQSILDVHFDNRRLEIALRTTLAEVLTDRGDEVAARRAAAPVCAAGEGGAVPERLQVLELCGSAMTP